MLHQGLARHTGLSFGTVVVALGLVILLLWIPLRQRPGLGDRLYLGRTGVDLGPGVAAE